MGRHLVRANPCSLKLNCLCGKAPAPCVQAPSESHSSCQVDLKQQEEGGYHPHSAVNLWLSPTAFQL